eukprot:TRINITY_DN500_c0_g1_i2.p1 TRINITY_DN500_c0_g1~~TRINITY_DN500_c0_g1_i2.p1  ORF type:complete len:179 (-),score=26.45 TRINITY_DN500_c0_g1_i2:641-1177(-)
MMQRGRWADLVDSSDEETTSDTVSSGNDTGVELILELQAPVTTSPHNSETRPGPRRAHRMPTSNQQPKLMPTTRTFRAAKCTPEQVHTLFARGRLQEDNRLAFGGDEGLQRRFLKRTAAIQLVKRSMLEHGTGEECGQLRCACAPRTPDPADPTISKRQWESQVALWRSALRQKSRPH